MMNKKHLAKRIPKMKTFNPFKPVLIMLALPGIIELFLRYKYLFTKEKPGFRDKVVIITGGTRGLGFILAKKFVSEGAKVAVVARSGSDLAKVEEELRAVGGQVLTVQCDVADNEQVKQMVDDVKKRFGTIDVLVNNAGIIQVGPLENMKREDFQNAINVITWGTINTTMAVLPYMEKNRDCRIVNITSIGGKVAAPHLLPYVVGKFASVGFSEGLGAEVEKRGIKVTTVVPGLMRTGSTINAMFKGNYRREYRWFSFLDSLPIISIDPEKAASKIIEACRRGDPVLPITILAHVAIIFKALFPFLFAKLLVFTNFFLPETTGHEGDVVKSGRESM